MRQDMSVIHKLKTMTVLLKSMWNETFNGMKWMGSKFWSHPFSDETYYNSINKCFDSSPTASGMF